MDTSNLCTKCGADNLRDSPFCPFCEMVIATGFARNNTWTVVDRRAKMINHMDIAPDDDGEQFVPMTADEMAATHARMAASPEPAF